MSPNVSMLFSLAALQLSLPLDHAIAVQRWLAPESDARRATWSALDAVAAGRMAPTSMPVQTAEQLLGALARIGVLQERVTFGARWYATSEAYERAMRASPAAA